MRQLEPESPRIRLRQWQSADFAPFARLNADPQVMEYFPATLSTAESDALAARCQALISERGWSFWAAELKAPGA